jgi:hypothetical protein
MYILHNTAQHSFIVSDIDDGAKLQIHDREVIVGATIRGNSK